MNKMRMRAPDGHQGGLRVSYDDVAEDFLLCGVQGRTQSNITFPGRICARDALWPGIHLLRPRLCNQVVERAEAQPKPLRCSTALLIVIGSFKFREPLHFTFAA